jgi:hypothetical protein
MSIVALSIWTGCGTIVPKEVGNDDGAGGDADGGDPGGGDEGDNGLGGDDEFGDGDGAATDGDGGVKAIPRCMEKSGTRLKRVVLDHGGEDADLLRFVDTGYDNAVCSFQKAYDGSFRCLPSQGSGAQLTGGIRLWTNPTCTAQIVEVAYEGTPTSFYVFDFPSYDTCSPGSGTRYHLAGSRLPYVGDETVYEKDQNGACVARLSYFNRSYYNLGAEIPPDSFVAAEEKVSTYGRLTVRYADGEDGSRYCDHYSLRDTARGDESCTPTLAEDGELHCLPYSSSLGTFFNGSSNCTTGATSGAAVSFRCAGAISDYVREPFGTCDYRHVLRARGSQLAGTFFYPAGTACYPFEADTKLYAEGAAIPASDFEPLIEEHTSVGSRLERIDLAGDGARLYRGLWWDPELASACKFRKTENGVWRCVPFTAPGAPVASSTVQSYGDASCTQLVKAVQPDCAGLTPKYLVVSSDLYRVYPVNAAGQQLYSTTTGTCAVINPSITYHLIGPALPFTDLVSAFESTL